MASFLQHSGKFNNMKIYSITIGLLLAVAAPALAQQADSTDSKATKKAKQVKHDTKQGYKHTRHDAKQGYKNTKSDVKAGVEGAKENKEAR